MENHDRPKKAAIDYFEDMLEAHDRVVQYEALSYQIFQIERDRGGDVIVFITGAYVISMTKYIEIRRLGGSINCILTSSRYHYYTEDAKRLAEREEVGLFTLGEFMGAMHRAEFWKYDSPERAGSKKVRREFDH